MSILTCEEEIPAITPGLIEVIVLLPVKLLVKLVVPYIPRVSMNRKADGSNSTIDEKMHFMAKLNLLYIPD